MRKNSHRLAINDTNAIRIIINIIGGYIQRAVFNVHHAGVNKITFMFRRYLYRFIATLAATGNGGVAVFMAAPNDKG